MDDVINREVLKRRRIEMKLTQRELAEICFISSGYVYKIERGFKMPSMHTLDDIRKALKLSVKEVFEFA